MKHYEHKTVSMNWFDAKDREDNAVIQNLGGDARWHVVGHVGVSNESLHHKVYFLLERVIGDSKTERLSTDG